MKSVKEVVGNVFVPLSGLASVNIEWEDNPVEDFDWVFVPLSGLASVNNNHHPF